MESIVYRNEFGLHLRRAGLGLIAGSLAFVAIEAIRGFPNDALGLLVGTLGTIVGLTIWSVHRYSRVLVTPDYLQIGRDRLYRGDLDQTFGVRGVDVLTEKERALIESPFPITKSAAVRIPGGAFGRISETGVIVLQDADGVSKLAFSSRRSDELVEALSRWLLEKADAQRCRGLTSDWAGGPFPCKRRPRLARRASGRYVYVGSPA